MLSFSFYVFVIGLIISYLNWIWIELQRQNHNIVIVDMYVEFVLHISCLFSDFSALKPL